MSRVDNLSNAMKQTANIRNIAICAHIDHGKTTFCDGLLAGAGMMSEELAGNSRQLDYRKDEIERGITIDAAATSMLFKLPESAGENKEYLVNLIDTPGHVDFGGDVTRAMRAVDGCIVLVDAVEGIMPQTETVLHQALSAYVKPILFINKVDRLIRELKLTPEQMQLRFSTIIESVNKFIETYAPQDSNNFGKMWQVSILNGSVLFGSAVHNWALSLSVIKDKSVTLNQIIEIYSKGEEDLKKLRRIIPLYECVIEAVVLQLPSPVKSAAYRISPFWHGDVDSITGKSLTSCVSIGGPTLFVATKVEVEKSGAEITTGRIYCGTLTQGMELFGLHDKSVHKISQIYIRNGSKKEQVENVSAGNIVSISGLSVRAGETLASSETETAFDEIAHLFEPVITKAIEAVRPADLQQLEIVLSQMQKEDPGLVVDVNKETGEYLISGYGELHLEIIENRIRDVKGIPVNTSAPVISYREEPSQTGIGKQESSLDSSAVQISAQPLTAHEKEVVIAHGNGKILKNEIADGVFVFRGNVLCARDNVTQTTIDSFCDIMRRGPLASEQCQSLKITIDKFHGENPGVLYPLFKESLRQAIRNANPILFEPMQDIQIDGPVVCIGDISNLVASRKGTITDMQQGSDRASVFATMPVAQTIGFSGELRSVTNGRGVLSIRRLFFEKVAEKEQIKVVRILREKKGLY